MFRVVQLRRYSPNSKCRPLTSCLLAVLAMFLAVISPSSYFETSEISAIFVFTTKTTQPRPRVFSINGALTCKEAYPLTRAESLAVSSLFVVCEGTKTVIFKPFFF